MVIAVMVFDLMHVHNFHCEMVNEAKNVANFGVDNSSLTYTDNRNKDILILSEHQLDGLDDSTMSAESKYFVIITKSRKEICLIPHYNAGNRIFYTNLKQRTLK